MYCVVNPAPPPCTGYTSHTSKLASCSSFARNVMFTHFVKPFPWRAHRLAIWTASTTAQLRSPPSWLPWPAWTENHLPSRRSWGLFPATQRPWTSPLPRQLPWRSSDCSSPTPLQCSLSASDFVFVFSGFCLVPRRSILNTPRASMKDWEREQKSYRSDVRPAKYL